MDEISVGYTGLALKTQNGRLEMALGEELVY